MPYRSLTFLVAKRRDPRSIKAKLFLPIIPIGIVAYAFTLLWNNLCRNSCIYQAMISCTLFKIARYSETSRCTEGPWTRKISLVWRVVSRFFSIYFTFTGARKIVRYTEKFVIYSLFQNEKRGKFLKKLWCCVGGRYSKIIWFYQLGW